LKTKILIDSISLLSPLTGVGRYTYEVSKEIEKSSDFCMSYFYGYISKELVKPTQKKTLKSLKLVIVKISIIKKFVRKLLMFITKIFAPTYDIYWQPNFIPNSGIKAKKIVTSLHDFSFMLYKDFHPKETVDYFEDNFLKNIHKSDFIITGSNYTKNEILSKLDFDSSKIKVIYHGINHDIFKKYSNIKLDFTLPQKFILSVGSIEPRKNLKNLLKAYNLLDNDIKKDYKLVLVGFKGWQNTEIKEIINANRQNIYYLGFISDIELAKVYNLASLFLFPSFYEGFGLPILEAFACETPVVCSNTTSLPEVAGDAALYCNPKDISDIKLKIELVLKDEGLQNKMIQKGIIKAARFSWKKSADEHIQVFNNILSIVDS